MTWHWPPYVTISVHKLLSFWLMKVSFDTETSCDKIVMMIPTPATRQLLQLDGDYRPCKISAEVHRLIAYKVCNTSWVTLYLWNNKCGIALTEIKFDNINFQIYMIQAAKKSMIDDLAKCTVGHCSLWIWFIHMLYKLY